MNFDSNRNSTSPKRRSFGSFYAQRQQRGEQLTTTTNSDGTTPSFFGRLSETRRETSKILIKISFRITSPRIFTRIRLRKQIRKSADFQRLFLPTGELWPARDASEGFHFRFVRFFFHISNFNVRGRFSAFFILPGFARQIVNLAPDVVKLFPNYLYGNKLSRRAYDTTAKADRQYESSLLAMCKIEKV